MSQNVKIFLSVFILSLPFWWGTNLLEKNLRDFFFWQEASRNPQILIAQIALEENLINLKKDFKPALEKDVENLEIEAAAATSVFINKNGREILLFEKNKDKILPIASLTKLMTALVVLENYDLLKEIVISEEAVEQKENFGKLTEGKVFSTEYLLYPLLMESSNDAAFALANDYDGMTEKIFIELMNQEAAKLNLKNTFFDNPTGLDPADSKRKMNYSTAADLASLAESLLETPLVWEILSAKEYNFYGPELINTNELLGEIPEIIGGKTGYTEKSGGCMLLVLEAPQNKGFLVNVILGSNDRFEEIRKMVGWLKTAYQW
ncbi:MAG: serine hydrolase [bacterium]